MSLNGMQDSNLKIFEIIKIHIVIFTKMIYSIANHLFDHNTQWNN
jgi:hypothetical protein